MMSTSAFLRTLVSGFIATFIMVMISFFQGGLGLPVVDVGHIMKEGFNQVHVGEPYSIIWGNVAYCIVGILLALIWVTMLMERVPGKWWLQGIIYGLSISFIAGLIVAPLAALAAGDSIGIFYFDTWFIRELIIAGLNMHLGYGLVLTLCLKFAGVKGMKTVAEA
ncbi:MAG: hypothetical protein LAT67_15630 [Balneolales bacterium]|nr:hypothetical protein [Balneolales bacterium]